MSTFLVLLRRITTVICLLWIALWGWVWWLNASGYTGNSPTMWTSQGWLLLVFGPPFVLGGIVAFLAAPIKKPVAKS